MRREVQAFVVHCTFKDDGCKWKGEVRHLEVIILATLEAPTSVSGAQYSVAIFYNNYRPIARQKFLLRQY